MPPTREQRIIGALLGVHAGDALGATCEFDSWARIRHKYPRGLRDIVGGGPFGFLPGHATDDTDLTRAVLLAYRDRARILSCGGDPDIAKLAADQMVDWLYGNWPERRVGRFPPDVGGATLTGLQNYRDSGDPRSSGAGAGQGGNGSLMRCIATGLFVRGLDEVVEQSRVVSAITHDDERCTASCAAYNAMVHSLLADLPPHEAVEKALEVARRLEPAPLGVADAIEQGRRLSVRDMAENGPTELPGKGSGYVLESLTIAVAALLDERPLEDVIVDVVRIGKDTDTNAAIAGGLLGARDGEDAIPERWRGKLQFGEDFSDIARHMLSTEASQAA